MKKIIPLIFVALLLFTCSENEPETNIRPEPVILKPTSLQGRELLLSWSISSEPDFENYSIIRSENDGSSYDVIATVSDINQTDYTDANIKFGVNYLYKIGTTLVNETESLFSNIESGVFEIDNIDLGTEIERLKIDPIRPYIYALNRNHGSLLFVNKQTSEVDNTISVGSTPTDMDISHDNTKLYIALSNSNKIAVVDLDTQQKINDLTVDLTPTSDLEATNRLVCIGSDKLVVTEFSTDWSNVALVDANNGEIIWLRNRLRFYKPNLITSPDKMSVLVSETHSTGSVTYRFNLETDGSLSRISVDNTDGLDWWHPGHGTIFTPISGDGKYIFYCGKKILYDELGNQAGDIEDKIYASNHDGSIAASSENIWDADNFTIIETLPFTNSGKMVFYNSTNMLYIYYELTHKLYFLNVG